MYIFLTNTFLLSIIFKLKQLYFIFSVGGRKWVVVPESKYLSFIHGYSRFDIINGVIKWSIFKFSFINRSHKVTFSIITKYNNKPSKHEINYTAEIDVLTKNITKMVKIRQNLIYLGGNIYKLHLQIAMWPYFNQESRWYFNIMVHEISPKIN